MKSNKNPLPEEKSELNYFDPNGRPRANPNQELDTEPTKKFDYLVQHPATHTFAAEFFGQRKTNEDRTAIGICDSMRALPEEFRRQAIKNTITNLQQQITEKKLSSGSTLCAAFIQGNTIDIANVGDSVAFVVIRDKSKSNVELHVLNPVLHHITAYNFAKLKAEGLNVINSTTLGFRLTNNQGSYLNMYRAMGDLEYEQGGLSHKPDIYHYNIEVPAEGDAFVILGCDGLTECLTPQQIQNYIGYHPEIKLSDLPKQLAQLAEFHDTRDNISVLVTPLEPTEMLKYLAVFDGHGGGSVSSFLRDHFHIELTKCCQHILNLYSPLPDQMFTLLQGRPVYKNIAAECKSLSAEEDRVDIKKIDKLLFLLLVQDYQNNRYTSWLSQTRLTTDISSFVENQLVLLHPKIKTIQLEKGIKSTILNKILWYAGENYPELVEHVRNDLHLIQQIWNGTKEQKEYFLNTAKLLGRLGSQGYELSSYYFREKPGQYVSDQDIKNYYDRIGTLKKPAPKS